MTIKNQTPLEWRKSNALGTAFLISKKDDGTLRPVYLQNRSYQDCVSESSEAIAFKWIPNHVTSYGEIVGMECIPVSCGKGGCAELGCLCVEGGCINRFTGTEPAAGDFHVITPGAKRSKSISFLREEAHHDEVLR